jgi:Tyrosine phosphatase family
MPATPNDPKPPASALSLLYAVLRGCLTGLIVAVAIEAAYIMLGANVHVVATGAVYRSARLDPVDLERVVRQYNIRTVVNLCGCSDPLPWYLGECRATCRLGVCQEDLAFSAGRLPPVHTLRHLVEILDHCDYPILIHCHLGIDRTGMASTIALLLHTDMGLSEAREQLSLRYGHLSCGGTGNIDRFFNLYQRWLDREGKAHSPDQFRRWVGKEYCPAECRGSIERLELRDGPLQASPGQPLGFRIRCTNTSINPWVLQAGSNAGVHSGWLLLDENERYVSEGRSGMFDAVVQPGESIDLTVALPALAPGRYQVQLDMIDEQLGWFYQMGATQPLTLPLEVQ